MKAGRQAGSVAAVFSTASRGGSHPFVTRAVPLLTLDLAGIIGELHAGPSRKAGPREPWLPRGTVLRNDRQVSALCPVELALIAARLGVEAIDPEWLGCNLLISGLPAFSTVAPGSHLAFGGQWGGEGRFDGGAVLRVEAYNLPCRRSGRALAEATGRPDLQFGFIKAAAELRGLVLSVTIAGSIVAGDPVVVMPPVVPAVRRP